MHPVDFSHPNGVPAIITFIVKEERSNNKSINPSYPMLQEMFYKCKVKAHQIRHRRDELEGRLCHDGRSSPGRTVTG